MEPSKAHSTEKKGREGSLDNPLQIENVPGHVIPILEREFDDFDREADKFLGGQTPEDQFIGFRLKQGVYGQRQPGVQMIPREAAVRRHHAGAAASASRDVAEQFTPLKKAHITTRQNIQIHHIPLDEMNEVLRTSARPASPAARAAATPCAT